ncbi:MAG: tetratricopeptide repeat protein [Planctomycetota bacterium]|jgi:tetratricopeptide (TPR) repeat protein
MRGTFRTLLIGGLLLFLAAGSLSADTIVRARSNIEGVTVIRETFQKVFYYPPGGIKIEQSADQLSDKVIRVDYDMWPDEWDLAREDLKNSRFQDAYDGFLAMSKSNNFHQAKQYGLFWAAETLLKWAEAGNGGALAQALATYAELLKRVPQTVHLAKAYIGMGRCYILLGKKNEALAELNKVFPEKYFKPEDKVAAKVQKAKIAELEGKFRNALAEYQSILGEAKKVAPEAVPLVKVRMGACKVGLGNFDDAMGDFNTILSSAKTAAVKASAYNGRGECNWKKKDYEKAMMDFLRVVVLYETITSESPKAFYYASKCMSEMSAKLRKDGKKDESKMWRSRSRELFGELKTKFPGSTWANK